MIDPEDIEQCIEDCEKRESKLSEWEKGFIQSLSEQYARSGGISPKQNETLEGIWDRIT